MPLPSATMPMQLDNDDEELSEDWQTEDDLPLVYLVSMAELQDEINSEGK